MILEMKNEYGILPFYKNAALKDLKGKTDKRIKNFISEFVKTQESEVYKRNTSFYIYGNNRIGKTWAFHCMLNHIIKNYKEKSVYFVSAVDLIEYHKQNIYYKNTEYKFSQFLASVKILFIDDMGKEYRREGGEFVTSVYEKFLRYRFNHNKITYISGNAHIDLFKTLYASSSLWYFLKSEYVILDITEGENLAVDISLNKQDSWNITRPKKEIINPVVEEIKNEAESSPSI